MAVRVVSAVGQTLVKDPNGLVFIANSVQRALVRDAEGPVNISCSTHSVLIQQEAPGGAKDVSTVSVIEQALIKEEGSPPRVGGVSWSVLLEELPGSAYTSNVWQQNLLQTEAPIVEDRVAQVMHMSLVADLERGVQLTSYVLSQLIVRTEPLSRDPERYKVITHSSAHWKGFRDPATVFSDTNVCQLQKQVVQTSQLIDPVDVRSAKKCQTTWMSAVVSNTMLQPEEVRDRKRIKVMSVSSAVVSTPLNPVDVRQRTPMRSISSMSAVSTVYDEGSTIKSKIRAHAVQTMTADYSVKYATLPKSQINVNAFKSEIAHENGEYLDPNDIRLKPVVAVPQILHSVAYNGSVVDPTTFRSQEQVLAFKFETAHAIFVADPSTIRSTPVLNQIAVGSACTTEYDPPQGIYPSSRSNQLRALAAIASPDYNVLPRSLENMLGIKAEVVQATAFDNPVGIKKSSRGYQTVLLAAIVSPYPEPQTVKPKRRTSTSTVIRP